MTFRSSLALTQRCSTGFPLVQMFREVPARRWFWVGLVGPGATNHCPRLPRTRLLGGGPHLCQCMPSMDGLVVTYRTPIRAALRRTKEQICTAGSPMAARRWRDGARIGPQGYGELRLSERRRMPESRVMSAPAPGSETCAGRDGLAAAECPAARGGDQGLYPIGHVHTACWGGVPL